MELQAARNILLCLRWGIGDLVMEMPLLEALRRAVPRARITALGARPALELLELDRRIDELICVQDWGLNHWGDPGDPGVAARVEAWLEAQAFDVVLDPSHAVEAVRNILWRRGGCLLDTGLRIQDEALAEDGGVAALRRAAEYGWGLGGRIEAEPELQLGEADLARADDFLAAHGLQGGPLAAISPVASSHLKRWPAQRLAALADGLADRGYRVLLFHGPQESCGQEVLDAMQAPHAVTRVGLRPLRETAALLSRCALFVGNDTGLMHMAAAVKTRVYAVFGPTSPEVYLPPFQHGSAPQTPCPHRRTRRFGPPDCLVLDRCLLGLRSCIDTVEVAQLASALAGTGDAAEPLDQSPVQSPPRSSAELRRSPCPRVHPTGSST